MLSIVFILRPPRLAHSQIRFSFQCPSTGTRFTVVQIPRTRSRVMSLTNLSQSSQLPKGECKQCKNAGYIGQPIWWDTAKPNSGSIYCISELGSSTIFPRSLISTKLESNTEQCQKWGWWVFRPNISNNKCTNTAAVLEHYNTDRRIFLEWLNTSVNISCWVVGG